jgi:uncharacterized protein YndB with AHSA1/START domain
VSASTTYHADPKLDLVLERVVDVPPAIVWMAYTQPEHLKRWFTPKPWMTVDCAIDLRPGGLFRTTMRSPEGEEFPNVGCYLEVIENRKLVWTTALGPGYRPLPAVISGFEDPITAVILLEPVGAKTRYTAIAVHGTEESAQKHDRMGFQEGWGTVIDQLVELYRDHGFERT